MKAFLFVVLCILFAAVFATATEDAIDQLADEIAEEIVAADSENAGSCALAWAQRQIGKAYSQANRYGPNSFDCSGLVLKAYEACGKRGLPTYTGAYPGGLRQVSQSSMQPGDILWRSGHVAIYAGNGQIVHAVGTKHGVKQTSIGGGWFGTVQRVYRV